MVVEFLKKLGQSKKGAAAVLGLGGAVGAGAILWDVVPHDSPEAQGAVIGVAVFVGVVSLALGPKAAAKVTAWFAPKEGAK